MKNKLKYIIPVTIVLLMSACGKDFLTVVPEDKLTADGFYRNETEIRAGTASLYGFPWFDFNDKFFWCAGDGLAGNVFHDWDQEGQFFLFTFTEGNSHLNNGWKSLYRVISYSNSIINDMPRAASGKASPEVIAKALGEARFMRAAAYFFLAEFWGEVPIVENSTKLVSSNNMTLPKNTKASVYEFIRRDLEFAAANLPVSDAKGRVTQWSAKGMLAKLHLTMAQNITDPNSAANFTKAKDFAYDVITNSELTLMTDYADLFKIANNNNPESLFAMQFMQGAYGIGNSRQANWARSSVITGNTEAWGGGKSVTYDFTVLCDSLYKGDARRKAIYMQNGDFYPEINKANGGYLYQIVVKNPDKPTENLESAAPILNNMKKYVVGSSTDNDGLVTTDQAAAINQYVLRLADVYLIYAEAVLGANTSTSDVKALEYFNKVRARGKLPARSAISFDSIFNERRVEFCLEGISWLDVKRFYYRDPQRAIYYLNHQKRRYTYYRITAPNAPDEKTKEGYALNSNTPIVIDESKMVMPIPGAEVLQNALLAKDEPAVEYVFQ